MRMRIVLQAVALGVLLSMDVFAQAVGPQIVVSGTDPVTGLPKDLTLSACVDPQPALDALAARVAAVEAKAPVPGPKGDTGSPGAPGKDGVSLDGFYPRDNRTGVIVRAGALVELRAPSAGKRLSVKSLSNITVAPGQPSTRIKTGRGPAGCGTMTAEFTVPVPVSPTSAGHIEIEADLASGESLCASVVVDSVINFTLFAREQ